MRLNQFMLKSIHLAFNHRSLPFWELSQIVLLAADLLLEARWDDFCNEISVVQISHHVTMDHLSQYHRMKMTQVPESRHNSFVGVSVI